MKQSPSQPVIASSTAYSTQTKQSLIHNPKINSETYKLNKLYEPYKLNELGTQHLTPLDLTQYLHYAYNIADDKE